MADFPFRAENIASILSLLPTLITKNAACEAINWMIWARTGYEDFVSLCVCVCACVHVCTCVYGKTLT